MSDTVISSEHLNELFSKLFETARLMLGDPQKVLEVLGEVKTALAENESVREAADGITEMLSFAESCAKEEYPYASQESQTAVLSAFLYFVNKDDAIRDLIPVIGYIDDLRVLSFAREIAKEDLEKYADWKRPED